MKKIIIAISIICLVAGCTDYYQAADKDLEIIKYEQNKLERLSKQTQDSFVVKQADEARYLIKLFVEDFKINIEKVKDDARQLELIKKFDRIYVLRIEK